MIATIIAGVFASVLALVVSLRDLIEMMSIGTLLAYTLVAVSVLVLRYQPNVTLDRSLADEDDEDYNQVLTLIISFLTCCLSREKQTAHLTWTIVPFWLKVPVQLQDMEL